MSTFSEPSWNSSDDYEDNNSSTTTSSATRRISSEIDIPGGVITTHCVSSVIKPGNKQTHDPLQFVKIQSAELSRKAVEQIRLAEEVKITKEKIKEVEEEWQNNLLNWKSKRRQSRGTTGGDESESSESQTRKIKTFSEILNEKAKSGHRIGYNLQRYIGNGDGDQEDSELISFNKIKDKVLTSQFNQDKEKNRQYKPCDDSNHVNNVVVVDTSLLKEYSSDYDQQQKELTQKREELNQKLQQLNFKQAELNQSNDHHFSKDDCEKDFINCNPRKLKYCDLKQNVNLDDLINENKSNKELNQNIERRLNFESVSPQKSSSSQPQDSKEQQKNVWNYLLQQQPPLVSPYSKYNEVISDDEDDDEEDEDNLLNEDGNIIDTEAEKINMLSFKAKLSAFENLSNVKENFNSCKSITAAKKSDDQSLNYTSALQSSSSLSLSSKPSSNLIDSKLCFSSKDSNVKKEGKMLNQSSSSSSSSTSSNLAHLPHLSEEMSLPLTYFDNRNDFYVQNVQKKNIKQSDCGEEVREIFEKVSKSSLNEEGIYENSDSTNQCLSDNHQLSNEIRQYDQQQYYVMNNNYEDENYSLNSSPNLDSNCYYSNQEQIDLIKSEILKNQKLVQQQQQYLARSADLEKNQYDSSKNQLFYYGPKPYQNSKTLQKVDYNAVHGQKSRCYQPIPPSRTQSGSLSQGQYSSHHSQQLNPSYSYDQPQSQTSNNKSSSTQAGYNMNHWVVQEAELRRLHYPQKPIAAKRLIKSSYNQSPVSSSENHFYENSSIMVQRIQQAKSKQHQQQVNQQNQMLSVSGRKKCSNCGDDLGRGCAAMVIESLSLHYHINCFRCSVCHIQLGNGTCGTDVRVRNHKLHCQNCYSNDEAGLKFSRV